MSQTTQVTSGRAGSQNLVCVSITYRFTYCSKCRQPGPITDQLDQDLLQRVFTRIVFNELSEESVVYQVNETTVRILNRGFDI